MPQLLIAVIFVLLDQAGWTVTATPPDCLCAIQPPPGLLLVCYSDDTGFTSDVFDMADSRNPLNRRIWSWP